MLLITVEPSYDFDLELQKSRSDYAICLKIKIQFKVIPWEVCVLENGKFQGCVDGNSLWTRLNHCRMLETKLSFLER